MKLKQVQVAVGAAIILVVTPLEAHAWDSDDNCEGPPTRIVKSTDGAVDPPYNICAAGDINRRNDIFLTSSVQRALAQSFGFGPNTIEPAGIEGIFAGEAAQRLSSSPLIIAPAAAAGTAASPVWNAWVDGRYLYTDYIKTAGNLDGPTTSGLAGIDYKLTSKFTAGLLLSADHTDLRNSVTDHNSRSLGGGAYVGYVLTPHIVLSANVVGSQIDTSQAAGLLNYDANRLQASAAATGYWYFGTGRVTPGLSFSWSKDWETEKHHLVGDRTAESGVLTSSIQIGKTLKLSDKVSVEPWGGAALDWTVINSTHISGGGNSGEAGADVRAQLGLNFNFGSSTQLAITGEAGGLLNHLSDSYSIEANLAIQF